MAARHSKLVLAPPAVVAQLKANREAYYEATKGLRVRPVWAMHEVWEEPMLKHWVGQHLDALRKEGKQNPSAILANLEGEIITSWEMP